MFRVPLFDDESATSYCARLAAANATTATDFCNDMGIRFQHIVDGNLSAILELAKLGKVDPSALTQRAVQKVSGSVLFRGELFPRESFTRTRLRVCPECLKSDDAADDRMPGTRRFMREIWPVRFLRTCFRHRCAIVDLGPVPLHSPRNHDFMECLEEMYDEVAQAMSSQMSRNPTGFEEFLIRRLSGVRADGSLLDEMPLNIAASLCEVLGTSAVFGRDVQEKNLSEDQLSTASQRGYELLSKGVDGLREFLDMMHASMSATKTDFGGSAIYGRFYFILKGWSDASLQPLKAEIQSYAFEKLPLSGDVDVFGTSPIARYMSEKEVNDKYGLTLRFVRNLAVAAGLLPSSSVGAVPKDVVERIVNSLEDALLPMHAAQALGVGRSIFLQLRQRGMFEPILSSGNGTAVRDRFSRLEIDAFVGKIKGSATQTDPGSLKSIVDVARTSLATSVDIIGWLRDNRLATVSWDDRKVGLAAVLIDPTEVLALTTPLPVERLDPYEMAGRLNTSYSNVVALIKRGFLLSSRERDPTHGRMVRFIEKVDADAFMTDYVSFLNAERDYDIGRGRLRAILADAGIEPAFPLNEVKVSYYVRSDVEASIRSYRDRLHRR